MRTTDGESESFRLTQPEQEKRVSARQKGKNFGPKNTDHFRKTLTNGIRRERCEFLRKITENRKTETKGGKPKNLKIKTEKF